MPKLKAKAIRASIKRQGESAHFVHSHNSNSKSSLVVKLHDKKLLS